MNRSKYPYHWPQATVGKLYRLTYWSLAIWEIKQEADVSADVIAYLDAGEYLLLTGISFDRQINVGSYDGRVFKYTFLTLDGKHGCKHLTISDFCRRLEQAEDDDARISENREAL